MQKLTINDAAKYLGISKEAIYNRIRRKTIQTIEENGIKYVIFENLEINKQKSLSQKEKFSSKNDLTEYLLAEINELKIKNKAL